MLVMISLSSAGIWACWISLFRFSSVIPAEKWGDLGKWDLLRNACERGHGPSASPQDTWLGGSHTGLSFSTQLLLSNAHGAAHIPSPPAPLSSSPFFRKMYSKMMRILS